MHITSIAFLYDIPKRGNMFTNKVIKSKIESEGFKCNVQILKEDGDKKPFWSGRVKFESAEQTTLASKKLKYFSIEGFNLRMLPYQINLANQLQIRQNEEELQSQSVDASCKKPDNSEEKCNIVVKNLDPGMTDTMLEDYFSEEYGPVLSCKVAKDSDGNSKTYGFVWFKEGRHANRAMLDSKSGKCKFNLDWYKILALRQAHDKVNKGTKQNDQFTQIYVKWRKKDLD